ncbi:Rrf2 family transcriptional regulator [Oceanobacter antarcticus]|uniref:Rrf2 family transcriptional regulator n=1 Tax=Oceanobacter antarcticus TaxID=3133425 RepID=A0ABW8NN40_9GAMM
MSTSTRFAVSVHVLTAIALQQGRPVPSDMIADSTNTHATVIRRILSMLNSAGITKARLGKGGGALLAKPASLITLLDIYQAVERETLFSTHRSSPNEKCMVGRNILPILAVTLNEAQSALEETLSAVSLEQIATNVIERGKTHGGLFINL